MFRLLFLLLLLIVSLYSGELTIQHTDDNFKEFTMECYEDTSALLSLTTIQREEFIPCKNSVSNGYSTSTFWFHTSLKNATASPITYTLTSLEGFADSLVFYLIDEQKSITTKKFGYSQPDINGKIYNKKPYINIYLKAGESKEIYISFKSLYPSYTQFYILNEKAYHEHINHLDTLMALYFGALLSLILYNFFIFIYTRNIAYIQYVFYILMFGAWQSTNYGFMPFESFSSSKVAYFTGIFVPLWIAMLIFFSRNILNTKNLLPKHDSVLRFFAYLYLLLALFSLFDTITAYKILNAIATFLFPYLLYLALKSYLAKNKTALFYIIAQTSFLSASTLFSLMSDGYLDYSLFTRYSVNFASLLEMLLFSMALAYRIKILNLEKIEIIKSAKEELENKILERTAELEKANERLQKLSVTDKLTELNNRDGIDTLFHATLQRYKREKHSFGVILIDIDKFKDTNDIYGHLVGDAVLQVIASLLKENIREVDSVGRWGGEEFLIITSDISESGLYTLANKLREVIAAHTFKVIGKKTISLGVALIQEGSTKDSLLKSADDALYRAKSTGRNRVC